MMPGGGPVSTLPISAVPGAASGPTVFNLPNPAVLHSGKRALYRFMVMAINGIRVVATNSATIRVGPTVGIANGNILAAVKGDSIELVAISDTAWAATYEYPSGSWTVV